MTILVRAWKLLTSRWSPDFLQTINLEKVLHIDRCKWILKNQADTEDALNIEWRVAKQTVVCSFPITGLFTFYI